MKKVILMVDTARATGRKFLRGLERYLRAGATWQICMCPPDYLPTRQFNLHSWFKLQEASGLVALDSKYTTDIIRLEIPKVIHEHTTRKSGRVGDLHQLDRNRPDGGTTFYGIGFSAFRVLRV